MSFNLGNNDRLPAIGGNTNNSRNPLQQAVNPANNRGADMVLTPDHPAWHGNANQSQPMSASSQQNARRDPHGGPSGIIGGPGAQGKPPHHTGSEGFHHDHSAPYSGGRANTNNTGPFRAGPDNDSYLPPGAVPQGARFDPIMPEGSRQGLPSRGGPGSGRPGQNPPGFTSGEPDYDELLPPN
ncbi:hypothetical protein BGZ83_010506 [Gryganskiella cystojenkinii]|nr:hypothetical protein BGZ83_010506 [Gryganskiella cystojenkinii]